MVTEVDDQEFADGSSTQMSGIHFNDDGTKMFLLYQGGSHGDDHMYVNQYNLSTPYDISTGTYAGDSARCYLDYGDGTGSGTNRIFDLEFSSDGLKLFTVYGSANNVGGADLDGIYRFDLTSAYDISTCSFAQTTTDLDSDDLQDGSLAGDRDGDTDAKQQKRNRSHGINFNEDGTKVFISYKGTEADTSAGRILEYNLSTPYDVTTLTLNTNAGIRIGSGTNNYMTMTFGLNGKRIFMVDHNNLTVTQITIGSSFDLSSSSTTDGTVNLNTLTSSDVTQPRGIAFSASGLKMFITVDSSGRSSEDVFEYDLACPFNIISGSCPSITENSDRTGIAEAQIMIAKRTIDHSTKSALHRLEWIRRNKDNQNLTNLDNFNTAIKSDNPLLNSWMNKLPEKITEHQASVKKKTEEASVEKKTEDKKQDLFFWSEGSIAVGRVGDTSISSTKKIGTEAITLGVDKFTDDYSIKGFAFRYGNDDVDVGSAGSNLDSNTYNITYYSTSPMKDDTKYVDKIFGIGKIRTDILTVLDGKNLTADRTGNQIYGTVKIKDEYKKDNLILIPSGQFDFGHTILNGYQEAGTGTIIVEDQHISTTKLRTAMAMVEDLSNDKYTFKRHGKLEYVADINRSSNFKYRYVSDRSTSFDDTLHTGALHNLNGEIGFDIIFPEHYSIFVIYERNHAFGSGYTDNIHIALGYLPYKDTKYAFSVDGSDNLMSQFEIKKNIKGYDFSFNLKNDLTNLGNDQEASINLNKVF